MSRFALLSPNCYVQKLNSNFLQKYESKDHCLL